MIMDEGIYEQVLYYAEDMVSASNANDTKSQWSIYNSLEKLCSDNEHLPTNHPLQWEALADFTPNDAKAISIYEKALTVACELELSEYAASIYLSIAERNLATGLITEARKHAELADQTARLTSDLELRREVSQFLLHELSLDFYQ